LTSKGEKDRSAERAAVLPALEVLRSGTSLYVSWNPLSFAAVAHYYAVALGTRQRLVGRWSSPRVGTQMLLKQPRLQRSTLLKHSLFPLCQGNQLLLLVLIEQRVEGFIGFLTKLLAHLFPNTW
jgi:hypothetical protein